MGDGEGFIIGGQSDQGADVVRGMEWIWCWTMLHTTA